MISPAAKASAYNNKTPGMLTAEVLRRVYAFFRYELIFEVASAAQLGAAKSRLLYSDSLSEEERALFTTVSCRAHRNDFLYAIASPEEYLKAGLSAVRCIDQVLAHSDNHNQIRTILDFACGYGRVARFLRARFPAADVSVCDIDGAAVDFCTRAFSAKAIASNSRFTGLSMGKRFDLIWCGSLITHIDECATIRLLKLFYHHLAPGGFCIFTTHGNQAIERMPVFGLGAVEQNQVLSQFRQSGYGYASYPGRIDMGISLVSREKMIAITHAAGPWAETAFIDHGWDNLQDVYGFVSRD